MNQAQPFIPPDTRPQRDQKPRNRRLPLRPIPPRRCRLHIRLMRRVVIGAGGKVKRLDLLLEVGKAFGSGKVGE